MNPILITGCARSGTSMTAGIVNLCGAFGGKTAPGNRYNKKGMFENVKIREDITKPFLYSLGVDPFCQKKLPDINVINKIAEAEGEKLRASVTGVLVEQGWDSRSIWFYKGAKMCLLWPLWNAAFPNARWILVRRKRQDIINSCLRTGFMRGRTGIAGWDDRVSTHMLRFEEMERAGLMLREVWPQKMIHGDFSEIESVIHWCGLSWKEKEAKDFISPSDWNTRGVKNE